MVLALATTVSGQTKRTTEIFSSDDRFDQPNIERIAQFSAQEHATILFTVGSDAIGYARDGTLRQLRLPPSSFRCPRSAAALSHDGRTVAYWSARPSGKCAITLLDLATGSSRPFPEVAAIWSALSWSPDDSEIAFNYSTDHPTFSAFIQAVDVRDGSIRTLVPPGPITVDGTQYSGRAFRFVDFTPVQWSKAADTLLVGFTRDVPNPHSQWFDVKYGIALARHGVLFPFADGTNASISPVTDRVVWFALNKIDSAKLDGTDRRILSSAPRYAIIFPGSLSGPITWSPDGKHILFRNVVSDDCTDEIYLLNVDTGVRKRFLKHTCIEILDWR